MNENAISFETFKYVVSLNGRKKFGKHNQMFSSDMYTYVYHEIHFSTIEHMNPAFRSIVVIVDSNRYSTSNLYLVSCIALFFKKFVATFVIYRVSASRKI